MKVIVLYRPESEHARGIETFLHDFRSRNPSVKVDIMDVDARDGIALLNLYEIVRYPAIMAVADDGVLLNMWQGEDLPLMNEVAAYAYSGR